MGNQEWIAQITETDSELWYADIECNNKEEAIELGMKFAKEEGLKSFRIGRKVSCGVPTIYADSIIDDARERLYDEVGEVSDTYLENTTKEQEKELEEALNNVFYEWHKKYKLFPTCYMIEDDEVITLKEELL